ncbi:hypothetical protein MIND_00954200 [Mycena indigotica]|uniref:Uncharacterized protein n=1 Tax=Mycena indigotica TaxID=2126181 RepID=A0A8H6VZ60_9AGAR|nr:uncharacterized protein MIND_00954200 [Mycena indigotica]KAF7297211.1 hypothetical protein MIND_00954200 [Mycena indigotica]
MGDSLVNWTTTRLSELYAAPEPEPTGKATEHVDRATQLSSLLGTTFAPEAEIYLNHKRVEQAAFADFLNQGRALTTRDEVQCNNEDCVETPLDQENPEAGSIVAGTATVIHTHPWRIRAAPAKTRIIIVFSAKITKSPEPRIVQLFHTWASKPFPIIMPHQQVSNAL